MKAFPGIGNIPSLTGAFHAGVKALAVISAMLALALQVFSANTPALAESESSQSQSQRSAADGGPVLPPPPVMQGSGPLEVYTGLQSPADPSPSPALVPVIFPADPLRTNAGAKRRFWFNLRVRTGSFRPVVLQSFHDTLMDWSLQSRDYPQGWGTPVRWNSLAYPLNIPDDLRQMVTSGGGSPGSSSGSMDRTLFNRELFEFGRRHPLETISVLEMTFPPSPASATPQPIPGPKP